MGKSRTTYSALNAIFAILLTLVNGLLGIVVTKLVIDRFGSDFNGLNSTANQIINVLLILEGGFTLASNVSLFAPLSNANYEIANGILSATQKKFKRIGVIFLFFGGIVALIYSLLVVSDLPREFVFTVIIMAVVPQALNLFYTTTYRVLLQTQQKEFIISGFTALTIGLGHITNIILINNNGEMWMVRFVTMVFAIVNCVLITQYTKKSNAFLDMSVSPMPHLIKGTNDVLVQKITSVIYNSWPIVFLSISPSGGTKLSSVYSVYNNVFVIIKSILHGVIDAPRLGFGQMLKEKDRSEVWTVFKEYEFISIVSTFVMMTTGCAMLLPFIGIYTKGVSDINYYDIYIATFMVSIATIEMLHIPSGHIINMSGNFRISKYFQIIACSVLVVSMAFFGSLWGVYGMLASLLFVAILLAFLEIIYVHHYFFKGKILEFIVLILPFLLTGILCSFVELNAFLRINGVIEFVLCGFVILLVNSCLAVVLGFVFNRKETSNCLNRIKAVMVRFRREK